MKVKLALLKANKNRYTRTYSIIFLNHPKSRFYITMKTAISSRLIATTLLSSMLLLTVSAYASDMDADTDDTTVVHTIPAMAGQWEIELPSNDSSTQNDTSAQKNDKSPIDNNQILHNFYGYDSIDKNDKNNTPSETISSQIAPIQCRELYNFGEDNHYFTVSGKEWTFGKYFIQYKEDSLPMLLTETIYDNNELDCSGNQIDQSGNTNIAFLDYQGKIMRWCNDPVGEDCPTIFYKVLP